MGFDASERVFDILVPIGVAAVFFKTPRADFSIKGLYVHNTNRFLRIGFFLAGEAFEKILNFARIVGIQAAARSLAIGQVG